MDRLGPNSEMARLEPLIGDWTVESSLADPAAGPVGRTSFEWFGDRAFVVQRSSVDVPEAPDGLIVIGPGNLPGTYIQHYFDSRGVEREFAMTFDGTEWRLSRLWRESPSFFNQRFSGQLSDDGQTIEARWEAADDGEDWHVDFDSPIAARRRRRAAVDLRTA